MKSSSLNTRLWLMAGLMSAVLFLPASSNAQGGQTAASGSVMSNSNSMTDSTRAAKQLEDAYLRQTLGGPQEEAAYQAFHKASEQDFNKKIKLGDAFLAKYPKDRYSAAVYEEMSQTYYDQKNLASFYIYSDKGLLLFPDDVHLLALTGWVIPRAFVPSEPDADKKLDKAETYSKHALEVMGTLPKPDAITDEQFAQYKTGEAAVAHSGLGLVYFRREQYVASAKELQTAIQDETNPDPTDLFILGADLQNLGRFKEASDAFNRCGQIAGSMQDRCKQYASTALKHAAEAQ